MNLLWSSPSPKTLLVQPNDLSYCFYRYSSKHYKMPHTHRRSSNTTKLRESRISTHPDRIPKSQFLNEQKKEPQQLAESLLRHHSICTRLTDVTFTGDKFIRLLSNCLKVMRNYGPSSKVKPLQKLSMEIGQLRRLLRVDRFFFILKDVMTYRDKPHLKVTDYTMLLFKFMIIYEDICDLRAYLMQLRIISNATLMPALRTIVTDIYFFQCVCWLIFYLHDYFTAESPQAKKRSAKIILRYSLDCISTHNDYSRRKFTLNPKITSVLGVISSLINLHVVWK